MPLRESIVELAKSWVEQQERFGQVAQRIRFNLGKVQYSEALEGDLIYSISPKSISGAVAAVDGGLLNQQMHGLDIAACRTVAVRFWYSEGKLIKGEYHPSPMPESKIDARLCADGFEQMRFCSLFRLGCELQCAIEAIEKWELEYMMLDGSIAPLVSDKPPEDSELLPKYQEIIGLYEKLYSVSAKRKVTLVGIMKDSRGKRFVDMLCQSAGDAKENLAKSSDTVFLDHLLGQNERTFVFRYSKTPTKNPILKDLGEWSSRILTMYIKPVKEDRPLRVEFLATTDKSYNQIASEISGLCNQNKNYAYPAALIEADLRAAMEPIEIERVMMDLHSSIGKRGRLLPLRRNSRPFR